MKKIPLPSPHSAAMNSEFTTAWSRGGGGVFIGAGQRHRLDAKGNGAKIN